MRAGVRCGAACSESLLAGCGRRYNDGMETPPWSSRSSDGTLSCPVAAACGGCPEGGRSLGEQAFAKRQLIEQSLEAACTTPGLLWARNASRGVQFVHSPEPLGYRGRIRMRIDEAGELAFFNQKKALPCPVLASSVADGLRTLTSFAARSEGAFAEFAHVEIRAADLEGRPSAYLVPRDTGRPPSPPAAEAIAELRTSWYVEVDGSGTMHSGQRYPLFGSWWYVPLGAFMQINAGVNELLVQHAVAGATARSASTFADLFSGCGNFALPLSAAGFQGVAVERDPRGSRAARATAAARAIEGLSCLTADASRWAEDTVRRGARFDLVLLDPPRAGLKEHAGAFADLVARHALLHSCSTQSLARDLRHLTKAGLRVESVTAFDMFPHTGHVEAAVWLCRE